MPQKCADIRGFYLQDSVATTLSFKKAQSTKEAEIVPKKKRQVIKTDEQEGRRLWFRKTKRRFFYYLKNS
jgi:hypothetical protein